MLLNIFRRKSTRQTFLPNSRIAVIGFSGAGKSVFSNKLAKAINGAHIELDALYWEKGWKASTLSEFRTRVEKTLNSMEGDAWVIDGNHTEARDIIWSRSDVVVWLDYSLSLILYRLFKRTTLNFLTHKKLWNTEYENITRVFSKNSLFLKAIREYNINRNTTLQLLSRYILDKQPRSKQVRIIRFTAPERAQEWLDYLTESTKRLQEIHTK